MPEPTQEHWLTIAEMFLSVTNFPNYIGAIDGKHIRIVNRQIVDLCIIITNIFFQPFY